MPSWPKGGPLCRGCGPGRRTGVLRPRRMVRASRAVDVAEGETLAYPRIPGRRRRPGEPGRLSALCPPRSQRPATAPRRSHLSVMLRLVRPGTRPLVPVMGLAVLLGAAGFVGRHLPDGVGGLRVLVNAGRAAPARYGLGMIRPCSRGVRIVRGPLRYGEQLCNHYLAFRVLALVRDRVFAAMRRLAPGEAGGPGDKGDLVSLVTPMWSFLRCSTRTRCRRPLLRSSSHRACCAFIGAPSLLSGTRWRSWHLRGWWASLCRSCRRGPGEHGAVPCATGLAI